MAKEGLTYEDVAAAASRLQGEGRPVTVDAVRDALGDASPNAIHRHLAAWRASTPPPEAPPAELPPELLRGLADWARRYAEESGAGARDALAQSESDIDALRSAGEELESERDDLLGQVDNLSGERDELLATIAERDETIERLMAELNNARQVAMDALVSKAKDQLAIDGKDNQLAALRQELERSVASTASESDARLRAEMELVGAQTARDSLAAEVRELRAQLESRRAAPAAKTAAKRGE